MSDPGRMAPNTALSFVFLGIILLIRRNVTAYLAGVTGIGYIDHQFIIRYIEPSHLNKVVVEEDIRRYPDMRLVAENARDAREIRIIDIAQFHEHGESQPAFLLFAPVYAPTMPNDTVIQRRAALKGWVYASFIGKEFISELINIHPEATLIAYSGIDQVEEEFIFSSNATVKPHNAYTHLATTKYVEIAGDIWSINLTLSIYFAPKVNRDSQTLIIVIGSLNTLVFFSLFRLLEKLYSISAQEAQESESKLNEP